MAGRVLRPLQEVWLDGRWSWRWLADFWKINVVSRLLCIWGIVPISAFEDNSQSSPSKCSLVHRTRKRDEIPTFKPLLLRGQIHGSFYDALNNLGIMVLVA